MPVRQWEGNMAVDVAPKVYVGGLAAFVGIVGVVLGAGPLAAAEASRLDLAPLTATAGDPVAGRKAVIGKGLCLSCHTMPIAGEADQGDIAPDLGAVADRLTASEMRLRIINPKTINPDTLMPSFHVTAGLNRVAKAWEGKPILTAQEVEDVVAYLQTLHEKPAGGDTSKGAK